MGLRDFIKSLQPTSGKSAGLDPGKSVSAPADIFAQTLKADGYKLGTDPCYDAAWDAYLRCLKSGTDYKICLAHLHTAQENCARKQPKGSADSSGLTVVDLPYVSADGGKTPVPDPKLDVDYDLCVKIANRGKVNAPSGPFVVRFDLQGPQRFQKTFKSDEGLEVGRSLVAVATLGKFPLRGRYSLVACVAAASSPTKNIQCSKPFEFDVQGSGPGTSSKQPARGLVPHSNKADGSKGVVTPSTPQTDDSGLYSNDTVHVSEDGETDEGMPRPDVEYVFFADFGNRGKVPSGPCFVRFTLSEDMSWQDDFDIDDGVKPGATVRASVDFGPFPNKSANYRLKACIYSKDAPDKIIACAGEFGFPITKS